MVNIIRDEDNIIITDSVVNYIPGNLDILLDNSIVGRYSNLSVDKNFFKFTIPSADIDGFTNGEHILSIQNYGDELKRELILLDTRTTIPIIEKSKTKTVINYEKKY